MNNQRSSSSSSSFSTYNFDFGIPNRSSSNRPLKDQKNPNPNPKPSTFTTPSPTPSWTPNKPSWTHSPSPTPSAPRSNPQSMVGDIFGKSWSTSAPPSTGVPRSDPNLFGDLVGSAFTQGNPAGNVPLKSAPPRNTYSMGSLAGSLPKVSPTPVHPAGRVYADSYGAGIGNSVGGGARTSAPIGGPAVKGYAQSGTGQGKDPFSSLMDFGAKPAAGGSGSADSGSKGSGGGGGDDFSFGEFRSSGAKGSVMNSNNKESAGGADYSFGEFKNPSGSKASGVGGGDFSFGAFEGSGGVKGDGFGVPPPVQASQAAGNGVDPLDTLFSSTGGVGLDAGSGNQPFTELNDWDLGGEFGGGDGGGSTTELEGLPAPPAGVSVSAATSKGLENYKQGQFADAIKWLSWAAVLIEKSGNSGAMAEVLTCRASCYKEVGEYKKAIADCSKVLDKDSKNVTVLVQRALLYESTEKYKLGAEDLRAVLKIDPMNRLAKTTIHRLTQLAG